MEPVILADLGQRLAPARTALVIVDMQKDFCLEGFGSHQAGRDLAAAQGAIPAIARLLAAARGADVRVVHVGFLTRRDNASDSGPWLAQRRRATFSSEFLCLEGSEGEQFVDDLSPAPGEWVVRKSRYSAFAGTDLDARLREAGVETVVIAGVSTNACIESTARGAFDLDYYIAVPTDAVASWNHDLHLATLANVNHRLGVTPTTDEIIALWRTKDRA